MIVRVRHTTTYDYADRVEAAAHMLHLRPRSLPWQNVHAFTLRASVPGARWSEAADHFGNPVVRLFLEEAHAAVDVATEAVVELLPRPAAPDPAATPAWERVATLAQLPLAACGVAEFAFASPFAPVGDQVRDWARASFPPGRPVLACLQHLLERMPREIGLRPGATTRVAPVGRVLEARAGACQDFAHLMIAGLRALRLPARYVSGYRLRTAESAHDATHAWVACWLGPDCGWLDVDPVCGRFVGDPTIWLGWGRDYADTNPAHGVLLGGGEHRMAVSVEIERLPAFVQPS